MMGADPFADGPAWQHAAAWLARHGLGDAQPTPLLAGRLATRRRAGRVEEFLLGAVFIVAGLALAYDRLATAAWGGSQPYRWLPLLLLSILVAGLLASRSLLGRWVRRVDRDAATRLTRRVTLPVRPGWRALLGWPRIVLAVAVFGAAIGLAVGTLAVANTTVRFGAAVLLVTPSYVAFGNVVQLHQMATRPVVAEDGPSLTADLVMRIEDARDLAAPTAFWSLPVVLLFSTEFGWWSLASFIPLVLGAGGLKVICARTLATGAMARQAVAAP